MDPLQQLIYAWTQVAWVFTDYLPSWWRALHQDYESLRNLVE